MSRQIAFLFGALLGMAAIPALAQVATPQVAIPQVTGPIAATAIPGSATRDYPFFASNHDLAANGYVEEEFFIKGDASRFAITDPRTATVRDSGHAYMTRIVVRRPVDPKRFNGTVLAEWYNVTNLFDAENMWFFGWEHMMRAGYVWVGVSPQHVGTDALKKWNPRRYGTLDVSVPGPLAQGEDADAIAYDIFSQAGQALRHPGSVDPLHGLKAKQFLAIGESQSAGRLATYVNSIHPLAKVYDGFLLLSASGRVIRSDLTAPVFKLQAEHDVLTSDATAWQPDTDRFRSWDVAGTSHVDQHLRASREPLELRDNLVSTEALLAPQCTVPSIGTRVPTTYVMASALDKLSRWAAGGAAPPTAPHLQITQVQQRPAQSIVARDKDGLALGGIRLSELAVPTGINMGVGTSVRQGPVTGPQGESFGNAACIRWGYSTDFSAEDLNARYPSHAAYVAAVRRVTADNMKKGYILPADAATTMRQAQESAIGH